MPRKTKNASAKHSAVRKRSRAATAEKPQGSKKTTSAGKNRAEGIRLFTLAGRPSKEDFVRVFGPSGPRMTWSQRAEAGVPAENFQAALASAMRK